MPGKLIHHVRTNRKRIAFTFDDGPHPFYTLQIRDIFREFGGLATFFVIGEQTTRYPETVLSLLEEGHELGNHTFTHQQLAHLPFSFQLEELAKTDDLLVSLTDVFPTLFRPPYMAMNESLERAAEYFRYRIIGAANPEAEDWRNPGTGHILAKTRKQIRPGSILLFHDGGEDRSQTVEAVRVLVPELLGQGYELVTVSTLLTGGDA